MAGVIDYPGPTEEDGGGHREGEEGLEGRGSGTEMIPQSSCMVMGGVYGTEIPESPR